MYDGVHYILYLVLVLVHNKFKKTIAIILPYPFHNLVFSKYVVYFVKQRLKK